jgi:phosphoribosylanthranilate isomerase
MTTIKICGLSTLEHALAASAAGADMIGLVFARSRRQIAPEQAAALVAALRQHPAGARVAVVGLFVNTEAAQINAVIDQCDLDYVQLSGDELPQHAAGIRRPVIKSLRLNDSPIDAAWLALAAGDAPPAGGPLALAPCPLLVDAHQPGSYGGTGTLADWARAADLAHQRPLLLAGGLTPDNVAAAIAQVQPWGVDVSSGVETDGVKDIARIEDFIRAARAARVAVDNRV